MEPSTQSKERGLEQPSGSGGSSSDAGAVALQPIDGVSGQPHNNSAVDGYAAGVPSTPDAQHPVFQNVPNFNSRFASLCPASLAATHPVNAQLQNMQSYNNRLSTFRHWPHSKPDASYMASVGFSCSGPLVPGRLRDKVRCFSCARVLQNWLPEDDPLLRHLQKYSHCNWARRVARFYEGNDHLHEPDLLDISRGALATFGPPERTLDRPDYRCRGCGKTFGTNLGLETHEVLRGYLCSRSDSSPSVRSLHSTVMDDHELT